MLQKLIYASQATKSFDTDALQGVLEVARQRNAREGITGMLLYADESFLQILEGEADALDATYARIARDTRHGGMRLLQRSPVRQRSFSSWSMGFDRADLAALSVLPGYQPTLRYPLVSPQLVRTGAVAELMFARYAQDR